MNDPKLKLAMARLLPEMIEIIYQDHHGFESSNLIECYQWVEGQERDGALIFGAIIHETEWLYVMQLVEQQCLDREEGEVGRYYMAISSLCKQTAEDPNGASFNTRATAMCKVKGIDLDK